MQDNVIPQYDLYGDKNFYSNLDFIHIEEISERSSANGWVIKPHRHGKMLQVLCMYSGRLSAAIDSSTYNLKGSWALVIPPGTVHGFRFSPDTQGVVLTVAESVLLSHGNEMGNSKIQLFKHRFQVIKLDRKNVLFDQLSQYALLVKKELNTSQAGHQQALSWLANLFFLTLRRQLDLSQFKVKAGKLNGSTLIQFRQLIEQQFRHHWTVGEYAKALNTSESTLNRMCKEVLGNSAKVIIHNRMLTAIKRRLIFTKQPLDQIAYSLGYKDPSYFSRFFKQHTGYSPSQFRREKADTM